MDKQKAQLAYEQALRDFVMGNGCASKVESARKALIKARESK